jgi:hypothetical protein
MSDGRSTVAEDRAAKGAWGEIFRNGLGLYSALVFAGEPEAVE